MEIKNIAKNVLNNGWKVLPWGSLVNYDIKVRRGKRKYSVIKEVGHLLYGIIPTIILSVSITCGPALRELERAQESQLVDSVLNLSEYKKSQGVED